MTRAIVDAIHPRAGTSVSGPTTPARCGALATLVALGVVACSQTPVLVTPRSFDRPGRLALLCFDLGGATPMAVPLERCRPPAGSTAPPPGLSLHAVVLQTARGQIAVVDLRANVILDSSRTVPGFTFIEAGALPVDVVATTGVRPAMTLTTYVVNQGTRDVWAIPSTRFRTASATTRPEVARLLLPSTPGAAVLAPAEDFLFVTLPEQGVVRQVELRDDGTFGATMDWVLDAEARDPIAGEPEPVYERVCSAAPVPPVERVPTRRSRTAGDVPYPTVLRVDAATSAGPRLLVGDGARGVVHLAPIGARGIDVSAATAIGVGAPVLDLALTPPVPESLEAETATRRYLYVLDDAGEIAVVDFQDGSPSFGRTLPVAPAGSRAADRVRFEAPAMAIAVVTPDYDAAEPAPRCTAAGREPSTVGPGRLHGVFLLAALTTGNVRVVDVYDRDAPCRGREGACAARPGRDDADAVVYLRRHRSRVGTAVTTTIGVLNTPTFASLGTTFAVDNEGRTSSTSLPALGPLVGPGGRPQECVDLDPGFGRAFPRGAESAARVCALYDPWFTTPERWSAIWEGAIVGGAIGRFVDASASALRAPYVDFCAAGVLGEDALAGIGRAGDQLVVTSDLPPGKADDIPACADLVQTDVATGQRVPLALQILEARNDGTLSLGAVLSPAGVDRSLIAACFDELVVYEVRARGAWVVRGSASGLQRTVATDDQGRCALPPDDGTLRFRAYPGETFRNRDVAFRLEAPASGTPVASGTEFAFDLGGYPLPLNVDASAGAVGSLIVAVVPSPFENALYAVDMGRGALVRIALEDVRIERTFL
jgi:hypothetical protein